MPQGSPSAEALRRLSQSRFWYQRLIEKHDRELAAYRAKITHLETVYTKLKAAGVNDVPPGMEELEAHLERLDK